MRRLAIACAAVLAGAALAGCAVHSTPAAEGGSQTPEYRSIPTTTNRAPDPTPSAHPEGSTISEQEAPLSQLWATVDSSLRDAGGYADPSRAAGRVPQDIGDFASAIATRCTPQLSAEQAARLDSLWSDVTGTAASAGADLTPTVSAYVDQATSLCL
ncbi:hypothetical protein ACFVU2_05015 [Leifsonia sp. NPDC058194]|uniref:hypothetical protein n=1 Tax=Leifsonia sp. NPDC058194 TaxID=3346374 RepID=UPI0036DB07BA